MATAASLADARSMAWRSPSALQCCPAFALSFRYGMLAARFEIGTRSVGFTEPSTTSAVNSLIALATPTGVRSFEASRTAPVPASTTTVASAGGNSTDDVAGTDAAAAAVPPVTESTRPTRAAAAATRIPARRRYRCRDALRHLGGDDSDQREAVMEGTTASACPTHLATPEVPASGIGTPVGRSRMKSLPRGRSTAMPTGASRARRNQSRRFP